MKTFWKSMSLQQMKNFRVFRERKSIIGTFQDRLELSPVLTHLRLNVRDSCTSILMYASHYRFSPVAF